LFLSPGALCDGLGIGAFMILSRLNATGFDRRSARLATLGGAPFTQPCPASTVPHRRHAMAAFVHH